MHFEIRRIENNGRSITIRNGVGSFDEAVALAEEVGGPATIDGDSATVQTPQGLLTVGPQDCESLTAEHLPGHLAERIAGLPFVAHPYRESDYNAGCGAYGFWGPIIGQLAGGEAVLLVRWTGEEVDGAPTYEGWTYLPQ